MKIVLATSQAQALAAKKALSSGQSWATVVKKYSIDPTTKSTGGVLNGSTSRRRTRRSATRRSRRPRTSCSGRSRASSATTCSRSRRSRRARSRRSTQATALIKQQLSSQAQTSAQTAVDNTAKKHWLSQTTCDAAYAMSDCKGYKAPKSSTTSSTPTATTG